MSTIHVEAANDGRLAIVTIDRPPLNVLDIATNQALLEVLGQLASTPSLAALVLRGAGPKAFCAGVAVEDHTPDQLPTMLTTFHQVVKAIAACPAITIAAVHGHCLGGGLELAASCDFVIAEETARFALPEIKLGCFPPVAAAWWPRRIGWSNALELMALGAGFDARRAHQLGLVTTICQQGTLDQATTELTLRLLEQSTPVLRLTKAAAHQAWNSPDPNAALDLTERLYLDELTEIADMEEGVQAFFEKRAPHWGHR
jgi:cyclohexa-1,5-dienecarbonyl-CoA hydratase